MESRGYLITSIIRICCLIIALRFSFEKFFCCIASSAVLSLLIFFTRVLTLPAEIRKAQATSAIISFSTRTLYAIDRISESEIF